MQKLNREFYEKIWEIRKKKGLTQAEVAEKLGWSLEKYQRWETGRTILTVPHLYEYAQAMEVELCEIIPDEFLPKFTPNLGSASALEVAELLVKKLRDSN